MVTTTYSKLRWTRADLELFPENDNRYEIIDGDLVTTTFRLKKPGFRPYYFN